MPAIQQSTQPRTGGLAYTETPEQKEAWRLVRAHIRTEGLDVGDTFTVKGTIAKMLLDGTAESPRYFTKKVTDNKGEEKDWPFVKVLCAITDPRFGTPGLLDFPLKNVGASFFDGVTKQGRSPNRGGMFNLHVAVTGQEPAQELKDGTGSWDTGDYENRPILLRLEFQGKEEAGGQYADRRLGMKIFVAGFEKDRDVHRSSILDDDEDAPFPTASGNGARATRSTSTAALTPAAATAAREAADLSVLPATDRQVNFIYVLGREAGMDRPEVDGMAEGLYDAEPALLTRKEASSFIDALRRKQLDTPADNRTEGDYAREAGAGKDELVSVGVKTATRPAPPEDDDDDTRF